MFGISAALSTPFNVDGSINTTRMNHHIKTVLAEGCSSVTFFGTTGEGASIASSARLDTIRAAIADGIPPQQFILTLHGGAVTEIIEQVKAAREIGIERFLLPPPCYYNDPDNQGLFEWFNNVVSTFHNTAAQFILYHIPQVIGVHLPIDVVAQLKSNYPTNIFGVKDSSGSFENTKKLLQLPGLEILVGDERLLADAAKLGASGAISGIANIFSTRLAHMVATTQNDAKINQLVDAVLQLPVTPSIKALIAHKYQDRDWCRTTPPLVAVSDDHYNLLEIAYDMVDTDM